jgi:hypothetical protein
MNKLFFEILAVIVIGIVGFIMLNNQKGSVPTQTPPTPKASPTNKAQIDLGSSGSSYRDQNNIFTVLYPNDYVLDTQDPLHIRIYKRGDTQRPQSEMSDGVLMVFESIELKGTSLEYWVDTHIQQATADGTSEIIEPKKPITQNGYLGFHYAIRGLGISQNIILQKNRDSNFAVMITYSVSDPKQVGYQKDVDAALSSLTILK